MPAFGQRPAYALSGRAAPDRKGGAAHRPEFVRFLTALIDFAR